MSEGTSRRGILAAAGAAVLFGISVPLAKLLVSEVAPLLLAGLLYCGAGFGLALTRSLLRRDPRSASPWSPRDRWWLAGAIASGGIAGPLLLMWGLRGTPASSASLLLNLEGVLTAVLAWSLFAENFDRRVVLGMGLIVAGGAVLAWPGGAAIGFPLAALAIVAACACWAIDNNLTQRISASDAVRIAAIKGCVAGVVNVALALASGTSLPSAATIGFAAVVGFAGYGVSLALFVLALRSLGTARTAAYFSLAPFVGALASVAILGESLRLPLVLAGALMGLGVWLHVTERHCHEHRHEALTHSHAHVHDAHHRHAHRADDPPGEPHTHEHVHEPLVHSHPHYPDIHHRHGHSGADH